MTVTGGMRLAAIRYEAGFRIDEFLARVAKQLRAEDIRLGGALQENAPGADGRCAGMSLVDLATRTRFHISQDLGSQAEGCRLDTQGLAEFVVLFDRASQKNVELLILNRFRPGGIGRRRFASGLCARHGGGHSSTDRGPGALYQRLGAISRTSGERPAYGFGYGACLVP